jgi:tetratricopeptide (TPR) repeat protein
MGPRALVEAIASESRRGYNVAIVRTMRALVAVAGLVLAVSLPVGRADASNSAEARVYLDKATAAFALNRYADAAENFEKAFELKPDPAVLYNAAQAHRLAGNKERALALYQSYLRTYGKKEKRAEIEARIDELKQAIEHDKKVANSPPTNTEPVSSLPADATPPAAKAAAATPAAAAPVTSPDLSAPAPTASAPAALVTSPGSAPNDDRSLMQKPWFWAAVGGGVAAVVVTVLLLSAGGSKDPMPSIGKATGN